MQRRLRSAWLITLIFAGVALSQINTKRHLDSTHLRGQVRDRDKKPLSNVVLGLYDCSDPVRTLCDKADKPLSSTTTRQDGSYQLQDQSVKPGVYSLMADIPGYLPKMKVPVNIPNDNGRQIDFILQPDHRNEVGDLAKLLPEDAIEIYAAAQIKQDNQLLFLTSRVLAHSSQSEGDRIFFLNAERMYYSNLVDRSELQFVVKGETFVPRKIKVINRLTGQVFEGTTEGHRTLSIPVTAIGTYDIFVGREPADSTRVIQNLPVMPNTKQQIDIDQQTNSIVVQQLPM